jgi:uncharacterized membrane protein (UPF0136 family)
VDAPTPSPSPSPAKAGRLAPSFTVLYGALSAAGGAIGWFKKGSLGSLLGGGGLGLVLVVAGLLMFRGVRRAWTVAQGATLAVVSVMLYRLITAGGIVVTVPVIAAGLGLSFVIWSEQPTAPTPPRA